MSEKQPVYMVNGKDVISAFFEATGKYSGLSFAGSQHHQVLATLNKVIDEQDTVMVSKICNALNEHKTTKMIGNANAGISLIVNRINEHRVTEQKD